MTADNRNRVSLDPLTFVIVVLASMMLGLILPYVAPLVNGTRSMDCTALEWSEMEKHEAERQRPPARELIGSFAKRQTGDGRVVE